MKISYTKDEVAAILEMHVARNYGGIAKCERLTPFGGHLAEITLTQNAPQQSHLPSVDPLNPDTYTKE